MHNILIIIDPQENKCKSLSKEARDEFVKNVCDRVQYHVEEENNDVLGTLDRRYVSDKHPFIFEELKETIIGLPNVHIPIQNKYTLGSLDLVNQVLKLHRQYEHEGGIKVEICGTNANYESLVTAMTLKSLIPKIVVEMNLGCISEKIEESIPFAQTVGIELVSF